MNLMESFTISVASIFSHKLRSSLTLLGVIIGVMTIIATMTIIKGLQNMMEKEMSSLATGVFQVQRYDAISNDHRKREFRPKIGMKEVRALRENVPLAEVISPEVWKWGLTLKYKNENTPPNITVAGGVSGFAVNNGYVIERGRFINETDVQFGNPVVVLGSAVARKLFPYRDPLEEQITLNGQRATVVGVLQEQGSMLNRNADNIAFIPLTTFTNWWGTERSWNITVRVTDPEKMDEAIRQATTAMRAARGLKPGEKNNFDIWHSDQMIEMFNDFTKYIRYSAIGIASIALLVAGVGIMNIMLVSVTERTREIGVRKALGARRSEILFQFLIEAIILTEIGAVVGVVVGIISAVGLGSGMNLPVMVPVWSVLVGLGFCSIIGLVFGTWPAWKASRLNPIEALRYE